MQQFIIKQGTEVMVTYEGKRSELKTLTRDHLAEPDQVTTDGEVFLFTLPANARGAKTIVANNGDVDLIEVQNPREVLRHHVTGAIERGEKEPIVEQRD